MAKYREKPVVIEAFRWGVDAIPDWMPKLSDRKDYILSFGEMAERQGFLVISAFNGFLHAAPGDWIIRGVGGKIYPCKTDIFTAMYELVED